jgi:hypothetical protein
MSERTAKCEACGASFRLGPAVNGKIVFCSLECLRKHRDRASRARILQELIEQNQVHEEPPEEGRDDAIAALIARNRAREALEKEGDGKQR